MLLQNAAFLWISVGLLFFAEKSEPCGGNGFPAMCDVVFRNACFEFVQDFKTWSQARIGCENRGGELLKMTGRVKHLLKNVSREGNVTWWLGEGVQRDPDLKNGPDANNTCTYMKLNPLRLVVTSDCDQSRGFVCIHHLVSSSKKNSLLSHHATKPRLKRGGNMAANINQIRALLLAADDELYRMETTPNEPTDYSRDNFIQDLLSGTTLLTPDFALNNAEVMNQIINCSTAILLLAEKKCDIETNPNPTALFENVFQLFQTVSLLLGTNTFIMRFQTGTIYQKSLYPADLSYAVLGSETDGEFARFPSYSAFQHQLGPGPVIAQLATFKQNPHPSNDSITGSVCNIFLSNGHTNIKLRNLSEMIEIYLPRPNAPELINTTVVLEKNYKALTNFNVSDPNVTIIFGAEPSVNVSLVVALSYGSPPTPGRFNITHFLGPKEGYRWLITPTMLQQSLGVWYIDTRLYNSTWQPGLTLKISSFTSKCMFWDEDNGVWSTEGCMVGLKSIPARTQCLCNHLTLFGSSFFVTPNYVDIAKTSELFATVSQNYVVVALLCAFFGLYLVTLLWACYADRRSRFKRKITLLEDNHPCALYNYLISFQTGHRKNAGTSASVTVKLIGSEGESDTHVLTDPDKPVFERGAVDMFLLAAPYPLGEVKNLKLQHDNTGGHPSWYVNKVVIQDLQTRHVWHFFCNCWLSADCDDGMTKKTFNAAKNNEIASFRNIFQSRTSTGFRDEHIWVSIVNPPSRSPFTRAQRVSCCMSLLLCTMAINIAFWNVPLDAQSPVIFSLGSLQITWQEFMVGVESGLLMFPINILIITIFRSIRPRIIKLKKDEYENTGRPRAITVPSILKDTEELISLVSRSTRNKMPEVQRLETTADLCLGLDKLHVFIQLMQGETESDHHWVYCSKFLLAALSHLLMCLEKVDGINFQSPEEYQQAINTTNLLVRKAEMVFSSHLACWSETKSLCSVEMSLCLFNETVSFVASFLFLLVPSLPSPTPLRRPKKKNSGSCWLPWWFVFVGWFLLLSISGVSTFFTLLYGFQYGKDKSIKWVMSLGLSLFQSIFILQPLKVLGVAVFFALLLKPVVVEETEEVEQVLLEQQDKWRQYSGKETV